MKEVQVPVFVNENLSSINAILEILKLKYVQLHGFEDEDYIKSLYRRHDLCDAFCIMIHYVEKERRQYKLNNISKDVAKRLRENNIDLESFRYVPNCVNISN